MCIICTGKYLKSKSLYCYGCTSLTKIPVIPGLKTLYCTGCTSLKEIPVIPGLEILDCRGCTSLTKIPVIPGLKTLYCGGCTSLTKIPVIPGLEILYCYGCTSLTEIPVIPGLKELYCGGCTWIPAQNDKFESNLQSLSALQRVWKRKYRGRRLEQLIHAIMEIYYSPDCKGAFLAQKEFEITSVTLTRIFCA